ncbi:MAG: hypothetical protein ABW162_18230 [Candidatus Sedimenticola sp. PURPLELP]
MSRTDAFDNFLPLSSEINPETPFAFYLELVAIRARQILKTRSEEQVVSALDVVDWILDEGNEAQSEDMMEVLSEDSDQDSYVHTDAKALRLFMPRFDIKGQEAFPNATWEEYFAILALAQVGEVINSSVSDPMMDMPKNIVTRSDVEAWVKGSQLEQLLEATETIGVAEFLAEEKSDLARAGKRGGKQRAAKFEALKTHVKQTWQANHQQRSNRDAARRIWHETPDHLKKVLITDEPEKRLEIWIGKWKKAK